MQTPDQSQVMSKAAPLHVHVQEEAPHGRETDMAKEEQQAAEDGVAAAAAAAAARAADEEEEEDVVNSSRQEMSWVSPLAYLCTASWPGGLPWCAGDWQAS